MIDGLYSELPGETDFRYAELPPGIRLMISSGEWTARISEIRNNTSGKDSFRKRFFGWFNMFRIVKYLNAVHVSFFAKKPVEEGASGLLKKMGIYPDTADPAGLLHCFRQIDQKG